MCTAACKVTGEEERRQRRREFAENSRKDEEDEGDSRWWSMEEEVEGEEEEEGGLNDAASVYPLYCFLRACKKVAGTSGNSSALRGQRRR